SNFYSSTFCRFLYIVVINISSPYISGIGYCFALEKTFPGCLNTSRVRQSAVQIGDKINNLKMLQSALDSCQIEKQVPINQLVNGKFMDNYEFFCWFHKLIRDNTRSVAAINPAKSNNQRIMERLKSSPFKAVRPHNNIDQIYFFELQIV
ncbi:MAG: Microtubule-associated protein RP/EB member 2, partial [Marteilia pararefringens]